jgi:SAM-dependent methyltransferase
MGIAPHKRTNLQQRRWGFFSGLLAMPQNKAQELEHARKILHNPEFYWNAGTPAGERGSLRRARWVMEAAGLGPGKRALEVGCGTGYFSNIFLETGVRLHSIDISPELLEKAVQRCGNRADFRVRDIEALDFKDGFFDAAVGIRVLHHLDMEAAFREIRRVLKKGGVIAFCEPNMLNPQIMIQKNIPWIKRLMGDTPDETAFFKWGIRKFLAQRGFEDIRVEPFDFLHPWIPGKWAPVVEKTGLFVEKIPLVREIAGSLSVFARKA